MIEIDLSIAKRLARSEMKRLIDMYVLLHRAQRLTREAAADPSTLTSADVAPSRPGQTKTPTA